MPSLTLLPGESPAEVFPINQPSMVIGKTPECDIILSGAYVSKVHARIVVNPDGLYIEDLKSTNATRVGGVPLKAPHRLVHGDEIKIGGCRLVYNGQDDPPEAMTIMDSIDLAEEDGRSLSWKKAEQKLRVITEISRELVGQLDLDAVLHKVLNELLRVFPQAERGFILFREDETNSLSLKASCFRRPGRQQSLPSRMVGDHVMRHGTAILCENVSTSPFMDSRSLGESQTTSIICAPLQDYGRKSVGIIQIDTRDKHKRFDRDDLDFLVALAGTISMAVEGARLHQIELGRRRIEQEAQDAWSVQRNFLPAGCPEIPGYQFWHDYRPARFVGGDYLDYREITGRGSSVSESPTRRLAVTLGDVSGKGMPAALLMARIAAEVRILLQGDCDLAMIAGILNKNFYDSGMPDRFMTLLVLVIDLERHRLTIVNAGHMVPMIRRSGGEIELIGEEQAGPPLGVERDHVFTLSETTIEEGETVLVYTDGVNEALSRSGEQFGTKRLQLCLANAPGPATTTGQLIRAHLESHTVGRDQYDDIALVCFGRNGARLEPGGLASNEFPVILSKPDPE